MIFDNVVCCNCNSRLLVKCGSDICPVCNADGTLAWVDGEQQEVEGEQS